jgi:hypothetical protein
VLLQVCCGALPCIDCTRQLEQRIALVRQTRRSLSAVERMRASEHPAGRVVGELAA